MLGALLRGGIMELEQVRFGQRVRVNVPGIGDHGQLGTVKKVVGNTCFVHLDWDPDPQHRTWFYAGDLELVPDEPVHSSDGDRAQHT